MHTFTTRSLYRVSRRRTRRVGNKWHGQFCFYSFKPLFWVLSQIFFVETIQKTKNAVIKLKSRWWNRLKSSRRVLRFSLIFMRDNRESVFIPYKDVNCYNLSFTQLHFVYLFYWLFDLVKDDLIDVETESNRTTSNFSTPGYVLQRSDFIYPSPPNGMEFS